MTPIHDRPCAEGDDGRARRVWVDRWNDIGFPNHPPKVTAIRIP